MCYIEFQGLATTIWDEFPVTDMVADVKKKIQDKHDIPDMRLIAEDKTLGDADTLASLLVMYAEPESFRLNFKIEVMASGGGTTRKTEDKEKRMADAQDELELHMMKLGTMPQYPSAVTARQHIEQLQQAIADDETPMNTVVCQLSLQDCRRLQAFMLSGREETRIGEMVKVLFDADMTETANLAKMVTSVKDATQAIVKHIFFKTYMDDNGTIAWVKFGKFLNDKVVDKVEAEAVAAASAGRV